MKQRWTRQLAATLQAVSASRDHPSAQEILCDVRRSLPRVSLGTVYRNLHKLQDLGRVRVLRLGDGVARYDATVQRHDHFVCESCGEVSDLERSATPEDLASYAESGFMVRSLATTAYGLCRDCLRPVEDGPLPASADGSGA